MAGLTREGLTIKKQGEVIEDLKEQAVPIFQDLVPEGDTLDTSDDSTLGRLIGLYSMPLADLWQAVQEVYWAFDPNSAEGVALDNLVAYGGLERLPASQSTVTLVVWGSEDTTIFAGQNSVRSGNNNTYTITNTVSLSRTQNIGVRVSPNTVVADGVSYSIQILSGSNTVSATYVAQDGDDINKVVGELRDQLQVHEFILSEVEGEDIVVETRDVYEYITVSVENLDVLKVKGRTEAQNVERGAIPQAKNTITTIATPLLGWDSVNNPFDANVGRERETDEELRQRFRNSKFIRAQNIADALYSALLDIDGVLSAVVYDNDSDNYEPEYDLPPHSFKAVVRGGSPQNIAQAIWANKPLGIKAEGNTSEQISDSQGFPRIIYFDRPVEVPIYIDIEVKVINTNWPAQGAEEIKSNIINYFRDNQDIGRDVILSRLFTPINMVDGHTVNYLHIGVDPNPTGSTNIPIAYNELATISSANININVV